MAVTVEDVRAVAQLARLRFTPEEEQKLIGELNRILEYMDKLNELDTQSVEPTAHVLPLVNAFRPDEVHAFPAAAELLAIAPQRQEGYFKVARIID
jgi:aspartyl-tRNA(Asn)/glutamyl-tRNA(Gln) amidotransferase subunit C